MRNKFAENDILAILQIAVAQRDRYLVRLIGRCMSSPAPTDVQGGKCEVFTHVNRFWCLPISPNPNSPNPDSG